MRIPSKISLLAAVFAFLISGLHVVSALSGGPVVLLVFALAPLAAGIEILRRRAWGAYGFALLLGGQLLLAAMVVARSGGRTEVPVEILGSIVLASLLVVLYFLAGRSMVAAGCPRGWAAPWILVCVVCTVPLLFLQAFVIPTGAMEDTLLVGDRILVRTFPTPAVRRDDLVVFRYPVDRRQTFVKRVIGVPGDRIRISHNVVFRNGTALEEPYAVHRTTYLDPYRDNFPSEPDSPYEEMARDMLENHVVNGEVVVPERSYFVLGDNRDLSLDSRYWGFIGSDDVIGVPLLIYDSQVGASRALPEEEDVAGRGVRWGRLFRVL
jgi:signal peptidase I